MISLFILFKTINGFSDVHFFFIHPNAICFHLSSADCFLLNPAFPCSVTEKGATIQMIPGITCGNGKGSTKHIFLFLSVYPTVFVISYSPLLPSTKNFVQDRLPFCRNALDKLNYWTLKLCMWIESKQINKGHLISCKYLGLQAFLFPSSCWNQDSFHCSMLQLILFCVFNDIPACNPQFFHLPEPEISKT